MPFGIAPFVGIDSLVRSRVARMRDSGLLPAPPDPNAVISEMPEVPGGIGNAELQYQAEHDPNSGSFLQRLGRKLTSDEGIAALQAGLQAGQDTGGIEALLGGFTGGLAARRGVQTAHEAQLQKLADDTAKARLEERRVAADEMRARADQTRADREPLPRTTRETTSEELAGQLQFLKDIGASPQEIKDLFLQHGFGARGLGGGGRTGAGGYRSNLERIAHGLMTPEGAAAYGLKTPPKTIEEAYVHAARIAQRPQYVGRITKLVPDPNDINGFRQVTVNVSRVLDPNTHEYILLDAAGNLLTPEQEASLQTDTADYFNPPPPPPPPPPDNQKKATGGLFNFIPKTQGGGLSGK